MKTVAEILSSGVIYSDKLKIDDLRIDADTTVICSVSFICSPPFVPMMAAAMKNRRVIVIGLSAGIIGYAAGNYLGFLISQLLRLM